MLKVCFVLCVREKWAIILKRIVCTKCGSRLLSGLGKSVPKNYASVKNHKGSILGIYIGIPPPPSIKSQYQTLHVTHGRCRVYKRLGLGHSFRLI